MSEGHLTTKPDTSRRRRSHAWLLGPDSSTLDWSSDIAISTSPEDLHCRLTCPSTSRPAPARVRRRPFAFSWKYMGLQSGVPRHARELMPASSAILHTSNFHTAN